MLNKILSIFIKEPPPEADPMNSDCNGRQYTKWKPSRVCPLCLHEPSHEEIMTSICLNCGEVFHYKFAAVREIFLRGRWREQIRVNGENYISKVKYKP